MEKLASAGITAETCDRTKITYYQKLLNAQGPKACPGMLVLINGIGLDREAFLPHLQQVGLPSIRLSYLYKAYVHLAPTVPGFEATTQSVAEGLLTMDDQAALLADFIRARAAEFSPESIVLYSFSYGSDLLVHVLALLAEDRTIQPLLARLVIAEINVNALSCFITHRIASALEGIRSGAGEGTLRAAHAHFFMEVLKAYTTEDISKTLLADLAHYFSVIITKNWFQLATNCREVTTSPEGRVRKLFGLLKWLPDVEVDMVFSGAADLATFKEMQGRWGQSCRMVRVFDATAHEHFYHMDKEGILKNLSRAFPER